MRTCSLTPAYGRCYTSVKAVLADFDAERDFIFHEASSPWIERYCNKADLRYHQYKQCKIRYGKRLERVVKVDL